MIFKTEDRRSVGATSGSRHFTKIRTDNAHLKYMIVASSQTEAAYDLMGSTFSACSYDPACRDISPSGMNISVHSY